MKNYLKRLKRELVLFLVLGFIISIVISFLYLLFGNAVMYTTSAEINFSDTGEGIFKKTGFADEPEKIFRNENLKFLSQEQRQNIEFNVSNNYHSLSIKVSGKDPFNIYRVANSIAESFKAKIEEEGKDYIYAKQKQGLEEIDDLYKEYKGQQLKASGQLSRLEPQLETLLRQNESVETLRVSLKERIANLEIKKAELLRIYTEVHPSVIGINLELGSLKEKLDSLPIVEGINSLKREVSQQQTKYDELQKKIEQLDKERESLNEAAKEPLVVVNRYAIRPTKPIGDLDKSDIYKKFIFLGLLIALIFSVVVAAIKDTVVSEFEISNIADLPLVATVPYIKLKKGQKVKEITAGKKGVGRHLIFSYDDSSEYVNAYRSLATHIKLDAFKGNIDKKVILISGPDAKVGKSTVSANLAIILARLGKKVALLDANLNRTSVAKFFGIRAKVLGISDILSGKANIEDCLKDVTDMLLGGVDWNTAMKTYGLDRLKILPSGIIVANPASLLESDAVAGLFKKLRNDFDCVIVDSPGLLKNPDSIILSSNADGIFLVAKTNTTSYRDIIKCSRKLAEIKIQFKGTILVCT